MSNILYLPRNWASSPSLVRLYFSDATYTGISGLVYNSAGLSIAYSTNQGSTWTTATLVTATLGTYTSNGFIAGSEAGAYWWGPPTSVLPEGATILVRHTYNAITRYGIIAAVLTPTTLTATRAGYLDVASSTINNNASNAASYASQASSYAQQAAASALAAVLRLGAIEVPLNAASKSITLNLAWSDSYDPGNGASNIFISSVRDDVAAGAEQSVSLTPIAYTDPWTSGGLAFDPSNDQQWRLDIPDELFAAGNAGLMGLRITSNAADDFWVYFRFVDTVTSEADAILAAVAAIPTTGSVAAIVWAYALRTLTSPELAVAPALQRGSLEIVRGDSYLAPDGNQKVIIKVAGAPWPTDLTDFTITFTARRRANKATIVDGDSETLTASGTVIIAVDVDDVLQSIEFDLPASDTALASVGIAAYDYDVQAAKDNSRVTLVTGSLNVLQQQTTT